MNDELVAWLRRQIAMDAQSAHALPHAIGNLQARWSPARLIDQCEVSAALLDLAVERGDDGMVRLLGLAYQTRSDYRDEWRP